MKSRPLYWISCTLLGAALMVATAQVANAQDEPRRREPGMERPPPPPHEIDGMEPDRRGGDRPLERFMDQLRERHPEEFERLRHMREENPAEFRSHLRQRRTQLRRTQIIDFLAELPRFREVVEQMTPEEREQVGNRLAEAFRQDGGKRPPKRDLVADEVREFEEGLRDLAREYHAAGDDRKPEIKGQIRSKLEVMFGIQEEQRRRHVEEAEQRVRKMQAMLDQRAEHRDEVIDRKLLELTDGDPLQW